MTTDEYVKSVPDEKLRTSIAGFLMRAGWQIGVEDAEKRIAELEDEKRRRVFYQDLVYHACNVVDAVLGGPRTVTGTLENPDGDFKDRMNLIKAENAKLREQVELLETALHEEQSRNVDLTVGDAADKDPACPPTKS